MFLTSFFSRVKIILIFTLNCEVENCCFEPLEIFSVLTSIPTKPCFLIKKIFSYKKPLHTHNDNINNAPISNYTTPTRFHKFGLFIAYRSRFFCFLFLYYKCVSCGIDNQYSIHREVF